MGDFARIQWFRLSTRTLATVLEPNLHMGLVSTRNWGLDKFAIPVPPSPPTRRDSRYPYEWPCLVSSSSRRLPRGFSGHRDYFRLSRAARAGKGVDDSYLVLLLF